MNCLLRPPFATPLYLILFGPEVGWYRAFTRRIKDGTAVGRVRTTRGRLFPDVGKWPDPPVGEPRAPDDGTTLPIEVEAPDAIETYLWSERRSRLTALARPSQEEEAVEARLVIFDGGYAFLTDDYQAKLATHLLGDSTDGEDAELELVPAPRLRQGDVLLFVRGSGRDVIRQEADKLLPPGERERAGQWRQALLSYQQKTECPVRVIRRQLGEHGCPLSLAAIENWFADENIIAPLNVDRELHAILDVTQDAALRENLHKCRVAIHRVRGAHLRASNVLARRVIDRAVAGLKSASQGGGAIELGEGIVLARVTDIDQTRVQVKATVANRLVEDDSWPG
jgi:hypothetical protein